MAIGQVFKRNSAGIRQLLQSDSCLKVMEKYASDMADGGDVRPFIGYDRAKCFITKKRKKK